MDIDLSCMTWLPIVFGQLHRLFVPKHTIKSLLPRNHKSINNSSIVTNVPCDDPRYSSLPENSLLLLPDDIIINILSRLDAKCLSQCSRVCKSFSVILSTPYFLAQATPRPCLVVHCCDGSSANGHDIVVHRIDLSAANIPPSRMKVKLSYVWQKIDCRPCLLGSYNGLLLFDNSSRVHSAFFIWNPLTREHVTLIAPEVAYYVCGIYFHSSAGEFRVLYRRYNNSGSKYYVLSLGTKLLREIPNCSQVPCTRRPPVILNGALHWTVSRRSSSLCSNLILLFKTDCEVFATFPHPGIENCSSKRHRMMHLMDMEGHLGLCDVISPTDIHVWVLQEKQVWVRMHKISTKSVVPKALHDFHFHSTPTLEALCIHNGELLLKSHVWHLYSYNLKLKTCTAVDTNSLVGQSLTSVNFHCNSLASLHTDEIIFLDDLVWQLL